jgi:hypothetical protein
MFGGHRYLPANRRVKLMSGPGPRMGLYSDDD